MTTAALVIAVLALLLAYLAVRRTGVANDCYHRISADLQDLRHEIAEVRSWTDKGLVDLRLEALKQTGQLRFEPTMTIAEAMAIHPGVSDVLASFHLRGCSQCAISDVDTLEGACRSYGIDQSALLAALTKLILPVRAGD